jgi:hypothetical protein
MSGDFTERADPIALFSEWLKEAEADEPNDPNAVALATVDADGMPNVRMVLLKAADERGFVFFTNYESAKGREILANPKAALCFHWKSLRRQVRVRGNVSPVAPAEADAYFASRARGSRLGEQAVAPTRVALRPREGSCCLRGAICTRRHSAPRLLVGVSHRPCRDRVLVERRLPAARPRSLHARWRGVDEGAALSLRRDARLPWGGQCGARAIQVTSLASGSTAAASGPLASTAVCSLSGWLCRLGGVSGTGVGLAPKTR